MSAILSDLQLSQLAGEVASLIHRFSAVERFRAMVRERAEQDRDDSPPLLPLGHQDWTLAEKYTILAAIHDECGKGERVDPYAVLPELGETEMPSESVAYQGFSAYRYWRGRVSPDSTRLSRGIPATDEPYLRSMLADVEADLAAHFRKADAKPPDVAGEGSRSAAATEQPPSQTSEVPPMSADDSSGNAPKGFLGGAELANALDIDDLLQNAFFQRLGRKRTSLGDDCWHEVPHPRPNSPRYIYRADSPKLRELAAPYKKPKLA